MRIVAVADAGALARTAADLVAGAVADRRHPLLLTATGETPMGAYAELARRRAAGALDTGGLVVAQLDEYLGIGDDDARSLFGWMRRSVCDPLGIGSERVIRLRGDAPDPQAACRAYDDEVHARGAVDLAVLGLGPNGHLGFNEPPTASDAPTRVVELSDESLASSARYWGEQPVPARALTAGMAVIMAARRVALLVSGAHKAGILRRVIGGAPDPWLPASWLHRHPDAVLVADRDALRDAAVGR